MATIEFIGQVDPSSGVPDPYNSYVIEEKKAAWGGPTDFVASIPSMVSHGVPMPAQRRFVARNAKVGDATEMAKKYLRNLPENAGLTEI